MSKGIRKHLKRLHAPKSWRLDKTGGKYAPMPTVGSHPRRESIPLSILLRRYLKVAPSMKELVYILGKKIILVNGIVRTDTTYPLGIMDVLTIQSTNEHYRVMYDVFKKFVLHKIDAEESNIKVCKVIKKKICKKNVPYIYTADGYSFRYCDPKIKTNDSLIVDIKEMKVIGFLPYANDMKVFVKKGKNAGCAGTITSIEKHDAKVDFVHIVDSKGRSFATKVDNSIVIGDQEKIYVSLPAGEGIKLSEVDKSNERFGGAVVSNSKVQVDEE